MKPLQALVTMAMLLAFDAGVHAQVPPPSTAQWFGAPVPEGAIRIDSTRTVRLCDCRNRIVTFRVSVTGKLPVISDSERPIATEIVRDAAQIAFDGFSFDWVLANGTPTALKMTVGDGIRSPGSYSVVVSLFPESNPAEPLETITVVIPEAQVEPSDRITIDRTVTWPVGNQWAVHDIKSPLVVRVGGQSPAIHNISGRSTTMTSASRAVAGRVMVDAQPIPRDTTATLSYHLEDNFPFGTTSGAILLRADELREPVKVAVEIRTRLALRYLLFTIMIAFVASWFVKVELAQRIQSQRVRALAEKLLGTIELDAARFAEREFTESLADGRETLKTALDQRDAETIEASRAQLAAAWTAAVIEAQSRRREFRARARAFQSLVTLNWLLPIALRGPLSDARREASRAATGPLTPDIDDSITQLLHAQQRLADHLQQEGGAWQQASRSAFRQLLETGDGLSPVLVDAVGTRLNTLAQKFPIADQQPHTVDPAALEPALRAIAGEYLAVRDIVDVIGRHFDRTLEQMLQTTLNRSSNAAATAKAAVDRVKGLLSQLVDDPGELPRVSTALHDLQAAWEAARQPAAQRQGANAAQAAVAPIAAPIDPFTNSLLPVTAGGIAVAAVTTGPAAPFFMMFVSSVKSLRAAKAIQTVILSVLFVLSTLASQSAAWDGTGRGLVLVFFAVVAVDTTVDALLARLAGRSTLP
jgi:hypothetical protein